MSSPWSTAVAECRSHLNDGPTDKLRHRKDVLGIKDGTNTVFKTFEFRRISAFTGTPTAPAGVFVNNVLATVSSEDLTSGEFTLSSAPDNSADVRATYYIQWFTDAELQTFLTAAAQWIQSITDWTLIPDSLQPAAKEYVAGMAYQKLVLRMSENLAETYQLYDAPDKTRFNPVTQYMNISKQKFDLAQKMRDDVYKGRKGQSGAPLFGKVLGGVRDPAPKT